MNRPRHRRRDPRRTGPIRNIGNVLRDQEPWRDSERQGRDAASRGVREGYRVIDEQIRRGRRMAQELDDDEPWRDPRYGRERRRRPGYEEDDGRRERRSRPNLLGMPLRHIGLLAREILRQAGSGRPDPWRLVELVLRLQIELFSELARLGFSVFGGLSPSREDLFEEDVDRIGRDVDESFEEAQGEAWDEEDEEEEEDEPWDWPPAPSTPATIRSTVPIPVYVSSHERTEIDLDLPPGSQSLDLEVEPPRVAGAGPAEPAFEAEFVPLADGPVILCVQVPRALPAGRYLRRVLMRATGEPVGDLTVKVGTIPATAAPKAAPKTAPKGRKKR